MYCKIIYNQEILDVIFQPKFVKRNAVGIFEETDFTTAKGIRSRDGLCIWNLEGREPLLKGAPIVKVVEIFQEEYTALLKMLEEKQSDKKDAQSESVLNQITSHDFLTLDSIRKHKIETMSIECTKNIVNGVVVTLTDNTPHHFELQIEDQINLFSLQQLINQGNEQILYHEKNKPCKFYSREDIEILIGAANQHRVYHTTYFNTLKMYINSLTDIREISAIYYGMKIPEEYQTEAFKSLLK